MHSLLSSLKVRFFAAVKADVELPIEQGELSQVINCIFD